MHEKPAIVKKCIALLLACASTNYYKLRQVHAFSIRHGVPLGNPDLGKHLIFTLVSLASVRRPGGGGRPVLSYAREIFNQIEIPNIFTWNTMIRGYAESEDPNPAVEIHRQMIAASVEADTHTYPFLLKAIAKLLAVREGEKVHSVVMKNGFVSLVFVENALVHFYGACGRAESAHKLFEFMSEKNLVAWNSVINGYALNSRPNEALTLFREMELAEDVRPDGFTLVSLLTACAELGALALGRRAHVYMIKSGLDKNLHAANALLDLYAKFLSVQELNIFQIPYASFNSITLEFENLQIRQLPGY
ncbi:OLC1v1012313C1 [Oldenlandia corymbosa var. corymbosa]|uniref:OLC1v1012313C1 n=1 Tax=Oldenlandia corymbosa var. corymbosa TaxID=529605 RepID=A0AAV1DYV7_OLDCO|nr:OLC1v1012313C1 [Oldenlandia corymbosa var. corymbosa]